jgi:CRISPR/Cas system-associated endonuclease Cas3-HD
LKSLNENVVPFKADKKELEILEQNLIEKIQNNNELLVKSLANKEETTRRFSTLSKKVKELVELVSKVNEGD